MYQVILPKFHSFYNYDSINFCLTDMVSLLKSNILLIALWFKLFNWSFFHIQVFHRQLRPDQRDWVRLVVHAGQHQPAAIHADGVVQRGQRDDLQHRVHGWAEPEDDVRDGAVLHHDVHDLRRVRQRRRRDWQRKDLLHLHDDRGRYEKGNPEADSIELFSLLTNNFSVFCCNAWVFVT